MEGSTIGEGRLKLADEADDVIFPPLDGFDVMLNNCAGDGFAADNAELTDDGMPISERAFLRSLSPNRWRGKSGRVGGKRQ